MVFEFKGKAKLVRHPNQESFISIEARDENEAWKKLRKYIQIGISLGEYRRWRP